MKTIKALLAAGSSLIVYLSTLLGILLSQYAPLLLSHQPISTTFQWIRLAISMAIAFYIMAGQESGGDIEGKAKNFKRRVANAMAHGISWNTIMGIAGQSAGQ